MGYLIGLALGAFMGVLWMFITISSEDLNQINTVCINNKGVEKVVVDVARTRVYCKDGAEFTLKD